MEVIAKLKLGYHFFGPLCITGHFGDESFQATTSTGTYNKSQNKREKILKNTQK